MKKTYTVLFSIDLLTATPYKSSKNKSAFYSESVKTERLTHVIARADTEAEAFKKCKDLVEKGAWLKEYKKQK